MHRDLAHPARSSGVTAGDGRLLDDLLVAALDGAVALEEVHDVAVRVAEHLDLDVARPDDRLLEVDGVVAEGALGLALRALVGGDELGLVVDEAHALAAAAGRGLEHHREADLLGRGSSAASAEGKPRPPWDDPLSPGTTGTPARHHLLARARVLSPMASMASAGGPMKMTPAASQARANSAFSERKP